MGRAQFWELLSNNVILLTFIPLQLITGLIAATLLFEEVPGWGYIGDASFREVVFADLKSMVLGHFNHPSIGVSVHASSRR